MLYLKQIQSGRPTPEIAQYFLQQPPLQTVWLAGMEYARIYPGPAAQPSESEAVEAGWVAYRPHLDYAPIGQELVVDLISIFFMGLLFTYLALKTGSLLPGIIFHYVHNGFVLLVQDTPGAEEPLASVLFYGFLWVALGIGALATKLIVERWPTGEQDAPAA